MSQPPELLRLDPVPRLIDRARSELSASFAPGETVRLSRAPGRLDVMGGIADYTGSLVCEMPLDRAVAVILQARPAGATRDAQVFSFNLLDEHQPFTLSMAVSRLADASAEQLRADFSQPGRRWAGYLLGCLFVLHEQKLIDLNAPGIHGLNLALLSTVPLGAGVSSSAAIEVATMMNLADHFSIRDQLDPMRIASMCQQVENRIVGAPCGIMDQATSCAGEKHALLRMLCQPHQLQPALKFPQGIRAVGINSNVKHSVGGGQYGRTRCAAFMAHAMILAKMRDIGAAAGKTLTADPMNGYLANLDPDDYKRFFRGYLPDSMSGADFIQRFGKTIDPATSVVPDETYPVQHAADHHVLEAMRVRNFVQFLESANHLSAGAGRAALLDKAGHLMYASHQSYGQDAMLGAAECDLLVKLARDRERAGIYGAKITGGGSGGTVAILCNDTPQTDQAIGQIMRDYQQQTGHIPEAFTDSTSGAWITGSATMRL
jgi:L-arabinokinase